MNCYNVKVHVLFNSTRGPKKAAWQKRHDRKPFKYQNASMAVALHILECQCRGGDGWCHQGLLAVSVSPLMARMRKKDSSRFNKKFFCRIWHYLCRTLVRVYFRGILTDLVGNSSGTIKKCRTSRFIYIHQCQFFIFFCVERNRWDKI